MLYRRNRYYDPTSGQFTQLDPIGLAGGLNLYGFAGGDPVNFSDPFGLTACDPPESCPTDSQLMKAYADFAGKLAGFLALTQVSAAIEGATVRAGTSAGRAAGLADDALVVRGGTSTAIQLRQGAERVDDAGLLHGVSVNSANGLSVTQLATGLRNGKVGVTTVGAVRRIGGQVVPDATAVNPNHALLNGVSADALSGLLTPVIANPARIPK